MSMYTHGSTRAVLYHCVCHWNIPLLFQLNVMEILFDYEGVKLVSKILIFADEEITKSLPEDLC